MDSHKNSQDHLFASVSSAAPEHLQDIEDREPKFTEYLLCVGTYAGHFHKISSPSTPNNFGKLIVLLPF